MNAPMLFYCYNVFIGLKDPIIILPIETRIWCFVADFQSCCVYFSVQ